MSNMSNIRSHTYMCRKIMDKICKSKRIRHDDINIDLIAFEPYHAKFIVCNRNVTSGITDRGPNFQKPKKFHVHKYKKVFTAPYVTPINRFLSKQVDARWTLNQNEYVTKV